MKDIPPLLLLETILNNLPKMCVSIFDRDLRYQLVAGPLLVRLQLEAKTVLGLRVEEVVEPGSLNLVLGMYSQVLAGREVTFEFFRAGVDLEVHAAPLLIPGANGDRELIGGIAVTRDITHRKNNERQLEMLSTTDPLTNLRNRRHLHRSMSQGLPIPTALLVLDIDGLKIVNDTQGHEKGDRVLLRVADILRRFTRTTDVLCRLGGDEFAILLPGANPEEAAAVAERIRVEIAGDGLVGASIGIATSPEDSALPDELHKLADERMYREKVRKKCRP